MKKRMSRQNAIIRAIDISIAFVACIGIIYFMVAAEII